jgi:hypothetical protein
MVATPNPKPQMKRERQMATKKITSTKKTAKTTSAKAKAPKPKKANPQTVEVAPAEAKAKKLREPKVASEQAEKKLSQFQAAIPEALEIIHQYGFVKGKLSAGDRIKLQYALRQAVASIRIGTRMATMGDVTYREHFGELRFHEALLGDRVIPIPDELIGQRKIWREIGELVRQADEPLHLREFCQHIGTKDASRAAHHVRKAERAGLIKKIGWFGGCVTAR